MAVPQATAPSSAHSVLTVTPGHRFDNAHWSLSGLTVSSAVIGSSSASVAQSNVPVTSSNPLEWILSAPDRLAQSRRSYPDYD